MSVQRWKTLSSTLNYNSTFVYSTESALSKYQARNTDELVKAVSEDKDLLRQAYDAWKDQAVLTTANAQDVYAMRIYDSLRENIQKQNAQKRFLEIFCPDKTSAMDLGYEATTTALMRSHT